MMRIPLRWINFPEFQMGRSGALRSVGSDESVSERFAIEIVFITLSQCLKTAMENLDYLAA
jgi:hypothetical protein